MSKAIGMVEYKTTSAGVVAADSMVKTSEVSIIEAQTVCPGKYIVIITGDLSAVTSAVDNAKTMHGKHLINSFVLGNPHESIFPAIYGAAEIKDVSALGIIESYDASSIIVAADEAAKTAIVDLIEVRLARGMCGKSYVSGFCSDRTSGCTDSRRNFIIKNSAMTSIRKQRTSRLEDPVF